MWYRELRGDIFLRDEQCKGNVEEITSWTQAGSCLGLLLKKNVSLNQSINQLIYSKLPDPDKLSPEVLLGYM